MVKEERIKGVGAIRDESSARTGEPVRIVLDIKRDADPNLILNQLYEFSPLQKTVSIILLHWWTAGRATLNLKQMLEEFLRHRVQVIRPAHGIPAPRGEAARPHPRKASSSPSPSLDEVIAICRQSPSRAEAKERLQNLEVAAAVLGGPGRRTLRRLAAGDRRPRRLPHDRGPGRGGGRLQLGQLAALERDEILKDTTSCAAISSATNSS